MDGVVFIRVVRGIVILAIGVVAEVKKILNKT
jgi:hypothetical protein